MRAVPLTKHWVLMYLYGTSTAGVAHPRLAAFHLSKLSAYRLEARQK